MFIRFHKDWRIVFPLSQNIVLLMVYWGWGHGQLRKAQGTADRFGEPSRESLVHTDVNVYINVNGIRSLMLIQIPSCHGDTGVNAYTNPGFCENFNAYTGGGVGMTRNTVQNNRTYA